MLQGAGGVPVSLWPQEKKKNLKAGDDPSHLWPRRVPSRYQEDTRLSPPGSAALAVPLPRVGRGRRGGTEGGGCWQRGAGLPWLGEVAEAFSVADLPGWDRGCEGQGLPCSPHVGLTAAVPCLRRAEMKGARRKISFSSPSEQCGTRQEHTCKCQLVNEINRKFMDFLSHADGFPIRAPVRCCALFCCGSSPRSASSYLFLKQF